MFELILGIGLIVGIAKIASADDQSPVIWGGITFVLCAAAVALVPLPFLRILFAGAIAVVAMIVYKVAANR